MTPVDKMTNRKLQREYASMILQDDDKTEWHDWAILDEEEENDCGYYQSGREKAKKRGRKLPSEG